MIVVRLIGGMGNQMFQYAFAKAVAQNKNVPFLLDKRFLENRTPQKGFIFRNYDLSIFNIEENFFKPNQQINDFGFYKDYWKRKLLKKIPLSLSNIYTEPFFEFNQHFLSQVSSNSYCIGYFQSPKYFENIYSEIKNDFSFKEAILEISSELFSKISQSNSVCLNVRRTDFLLNQTHGTLTSNYYQDAINLIQTEEKDLVIFVFSDDIEWCQSNLNFNLPTHFVNYEHKGYKFGNYLQLMINCKHFIIPNSTFAWWAAFLNSNPNKKVIAPKKWFNDSSYNSNDIYPSDWITI